MGSGGRAQPCVASSHRARGALRGPRAQIITLQSLGCFTADPTSRDAALYRPGRAQPREHRQGLAAVSHGNEAWQVESCPELGFTVQGAQPDTLHRACAVPRAARAPVVGLEAVEQRG